MNSSFKIGRRQLLQGAAALSTAALGVSGFGLRRARAQGEPIKVGIALDMTGGLGAVGIAGVNSAKLVTKNINDAGGLLGRPIELHLADTASNESVGVANVRTLMQREKPVVVIGGLASSMRNAIKDTIIGRGKSLYFYPSLYEGQECTPYLYCTGAVPNQQCDTFIPWLIRNGGKRFAIPGSDYIFPRTLNKYVKSVVTASGGEIVYEEYFPLDQIDFTSTSSKILDARADVVINNVIPPGGGSLIKTLNQAGFNTTKGGRFASFYYDENALNFNTPEEMEGLASCLDWFQSVADSEPLSANILKQYNEMFPGPIKFTAGNSAVSVCRALSLWAGAVKKAGNVDRDSVTAALEGMEVEVPGGLATIVRGKRHTKMNMFIAVSNKGRFQVVDQSASPVEPKEC
jgi:branched-chain amino acid transport system substrate-binding protein